MLDFSNYTIVTSVHSKDHKYLDHWFTSIFTALQNTTILLMGDVVNIDQVKYYELSKLHDIKFNCYHLPECSPAQHKAIALGKAVTPYLINIDSDVISTYDSFDTVKLFHEATILRKDSLLCLGFFDYKNTRGYDDWTRNRLPWKELYTKDYSHHFRHLENTGDNWIKPTVNISPWYCVATSTIDSKLLSALETYTIGVRGYDQFLCNELTKRGVDAYYLASTNYHLGVDSPRINEVWKTEVLL